MKKGKVLVIGSGGREHALGWKLGKSDEVKEVIYAPGNAGTQEDKGRNVAIDSTKKENFEAVKDFIQAGNIDMTVVGPEQPLADGLVDYLHTHGHKRVFGPSKKAAQLESDKFFSYNLMEELNIPQADSIMCYETVEALDAIGEIGNKYANGVVIKARGLTGGKGVTVCDNANEAISEIQNHSKSYGPEVLIAQRLYGQEFSVFGISDGESVSPLEIALQDHKPLLEEDEGPNTGGMGAYGPAPIASTEVVRNVAENMMTPVVQLMNKKGNEYKGFMYAGCMMTQEGPKIIEFNIRFGDPESVSYTHLTLPTSG